MRGMFKNVFSYALRSLIFFLSVFAYLFSNEHNMCKPYSTVLKPIKLFAPAVTPFKPYASAVASYKPIHHQ